MMGPRVLLPILVGVLAIAGVGSSGSAIALAFVAGIVAGAAAALSLTWCALTPNARMLVRASIAARRQGA